MASLRTILFLSVGLVSSLNIPRDAEHSVGDTLANVANGISLPVKRVETLDSVEDPHHAEIEYLAAKHGFQPNEEHLARRQTVSGSSSATPALDRAAQYNIQLVIGNQTCNVNPDLGSRVLWVATPAIASGRPAPYSFDPRASTNTYCANSTYWNITYGTNGNGASFAGNLCLTQVALPSNPDAKVYHYVYSANASRSVASNGIFGISHDTEQGYLLNGEQASTFTFYQRLLARAPQPLFTMDYKYDSSGRFDVGFIDYTKNTSAITYVARPNNVGGQWKISARGISITSPSTYSDPNYTFAFNMDSGASFTNLPADLVTRYYAGVVGASRASGSWRFPCNSKLPDLQLFFSGRPMTLPGTYMIYNKGSDGTCLGSIQNTGSSDGSGFVGTSFIRPNFFVFLNSSSTYPSGAIGFASKRLPAPPAP